MSFEKKRIPSQGIHLAIFLTISCCFWAIVSSGQTALQLKRMPPPKEGTAPAVRNPFAKDRKLIPAYNNEETPSAVSERSLPKKLIKMKEIETGGVSDGGSGTGEVCFFPWNENTQKWVSNVGDLAIDEEGKVRPEYRSHIHWVVLTEQAESLREKDQLGGRSGQVFSGAKALPGETPDIYLERMIATKIQPLSPLFANHLRRALQATHPKTWIPVPEGLKRIDDLGKTPGLSRPVPESRANDCRTVQIVRRFDQLPAGSKEYAPAVVKIEYDPDLYDRLVGTGEISDESNPERGVVAKSALWLHEALYALGVQLGHRNSVPARFATRAILSDLTYIFGIKTGFEFLWMLDSLGYLTPEFFGFENLSPTSIDYQRLETLANIFHVLHNSQKNNSTQFENSFCEKMQDQWPDMDCHYLTAHNKRQFEFFWNYYLSNQKILDESNAFSWIFFSALLSYTQPASYFESLFRPDAMSSKRIQAQCKWILDLEEYAKRLHPTYFLIPFRDLQQDLTPEKLVKQNRQLPHKAEKHCKELKDSRSF